MKTVTSPSSKDFSDLSAKMIAAELPDVLLSFTEEFFQIFIVSIFKITTLRKSLLSHTMHYEMKLYRLMY